MKDRFYVYLAGPIAGLTDSEANGWRKNAEIFFDNKCPNGVIKAVSPLRNEPANKDGIYDDQLHLGDRQDWFVTPRCIASKNWFDVQNCDIVLVYYPGNLCDNRPSFGTIIEIGWAIALGKPLYLVTDDGYLKKHPLIDRNAAFISDNLNDALNAIVHTYEVYS
jgi:nucleoside 2-deoxyribosyltransferase